MNGNSEDYKIFSDKTFLAEIKCLFLLSESLHYVERVPV